MNGLACFSPASVRLRVGEERARSSEAGEKGHRRLSEASSASRPPSKRAFHSSLESQMKGLSQLQQSWLGERPLKHEGVMRPAPQLVESVREPKPGSFCGLKDQGFGSLRRFACYCLRSEQPWQPSRLTTGDAFIAY